MAKGEVVAKLGPLAVGVAGVGATAISGAALIVASGGAVALALGGYGLYKYLSASNADAPKEMFGDKATTLWEYTKDNRKKTGPVPFSRLLEMLASGELQPTNMVHQVGAGGWMKACEA
jgi:hypothetical protein